MGKTSDVPGDQYDSPWKDIIESHFPAFLAFFFSEIHDAIDWHTPPVFLDKELQKIRPENELGRKYVDKLVEVRLLEGTEVWILIHIEVQVDKDGNFTLRMFVYNYRIFDRFGREVISLAILGDDDPDWRPNRYEYGRFGSKHAFEFPIVKLLDYRDRLAELEAEDNPFALATLAHLASRLTKSDRQQRYKWKLRLYRLLLGKGWTRTQIRDLMRFMDYMLTLPKDLDKQLEDTLHSELGGERMRYISSFERMAEEKGLDKGRKEGALEMLTGLLRARFGDLPDWARDRVAKADEAELMTWGTNTLTADSLEAALADRSTA